MARILWIGTALLVVVGALAAESDPTQKPFVKKFKVKSIDRKLRTIGVSDPGLDVVWDPEKTVFYHHRSIPLRSLAKGTVLNVLGKLHAKRSSTGSTYSDSDTLISDVEYIGTGRAYQEPPLAGKTGYIKWHLCELTSTQLPYFVKIDDSEYKLTGDEKTAAYSLDELLPHKVAGKTAVVCGNVRKVTVERNGKPKQVSRLLVTDVHLTDLNPQHLKVFQIQWADRKKIEFRPPPPEDEEESKEPKEEPKDEPIAAPKTEKEGRVSR